MSTFAIGLTACSDRGPSASAGSPVDGLHALAVSAAGATGYPIDALQVLAGGVHLRVSITDAKLAKSDQATRERAANNVIAALEQAMARRADMAALMEISIAIVHPTGDGDADKDSHLEDVLSFRKGPSGRFAHHVS
jgi:hypothetical protein